MAKDKIAVTHWVDGPRISPKSPAAWVSAGYDDAKCVEHVAGLSDTDRRPYECYASQSEEEYFAQNANAYLNTNLGVDATTQQPRNNTRKWVARTTSPPTCSRCSTSSSSRASSTSSSPTGS